MRLAVTYPPLCERSVLLPERPELMENSVGDCLSVMLQEDMLMGRDRLYGSRFNAEADTTVNSRPKHVWDLCFLDSYLCPQPVPPDVDGGVCTEQHRQPTPPRQIHPGTTARNPPGHQHQLQSSLSILNTSINHRKLLLVFTSNGSLEASRGSTRALNSESWLRCCSS